MHKTKSRTDDLDRLLGKELENKSFLRAWEDSEPKRELAIKLARLRSDRNLTKSELAAKAGWDKAYVSRLESASGPIPALRTIARYVKACGADANLVFGAIEADGARGVYKVSLSGMDAEHDVSKTYPKLRAKIKRRVTHHHSTKKLSVA